MMLDHVWFAWSGALSEQSSIGKYYGILEGESEILTQNVENAPKVNMYTYVLYVCSFCKEEEAWNLLYAVI